MSIVVFIVVTILADIYITTVNHSPVNVDQINFALAILIGLGSSIWFCLTRDKWKAIIDGIREGIYGNSNKNNETDDLKNENESKELRTVLKNFFIGGVV